jgi:hypothetical protein
LIILIILGEWLRKHVPVEKQQILNNATAGRNNRRTVFFVVRAELLQAREKVSCRLSSVKEAVKIEPERVKLRISCVRSHCQGTAGEDTAGWRRLINCFGLS